MNQQTFNHIINAGEPVSITADLMDAAYENAKRERSEALHRGAQWIHKQVGAALLRTNPLKSTDRFFASTAISVAAIVGANSVNQR